MGYPQAVRVTRDPLASQAGAPLAPLVSSRATQQNRETFESCKQSSVAGNDSMMTTSELSDWIDASRVEQDSPGAQLGVSNTWVSVAHRYFYMATPKVASSKIKIALQELEGFELPPHPLRIHWRDAPGLSFVQSIWDFTTPDAVEILTSPSWFRFCFVREPYSRLLSAYTQKVMDLTSPWVGFRESIREHAGYPTPPGVAPGTVGFGDFVRYIGEQDDGDRDGHWRSQVGTLHIDRIDYDFIGRMESFTHDFTQVLQRFDAPSELIDSVPKVVNATQTSPLAAAYDKRLADYVYQVFRDDFAAFGYRRDAWKVEA